MGVIANFFDWLYKLLVRALVSIKSTAVQISAAITGVIAAVGGMFSHFTWLDGTVAWIEEATSTISSFMGGDFGIMGTVFFGWFNLGRLVQCLSVLLAATVGATVAILVTVFVGVFALVPLVLGVRAILKAIRTGTAGLIDP